MSKVHFSLYDDRRAIRAWMTASVADSLIGSLSADPETIGELQRAMCRFFHPEFARTVQSSWTSASDVPRRQDGLGVISIDLPGRLLVTQWNQSQRRRYAASLGADGRVQDYYPYDLSHEWLLKQSQVYLPDMAVARRRQRRQTRVAVRDILFGNPLVDFLVEHSQRALVDEKPSLSKDWSQQRKSGWFRQDDGIYRIARRIHKEWLLSDHTQLGGRRLRDVMLLDREHISTDMSHRISQWAMQNECPAGLSVTDSAFVRGGLGTHEIILYYDLVRELLFTYFEHAIEHAHRDDDGAPRLQQRRDDWMDTPQSGMLMGYTPREAIERERLRLPLVEPNKHGVFHEDCPVCRMSAELGLGPAFVYLDDLHVDDDFAFSMHIREEEWKQERAEFNARFSHPSDCDGDFENDGDSPSIRPADAIWQRVYVNEDLLGQSVSEKVMAIGFFLAELVDDVKRQASDDELVKQLNRHFDNLAPATKPGGRCVLQPVISRLGEAIDDVAQQCPELTDKCHDLQTRLARMSEML